MIIDLLHVHFGLCLVEVYNLDILAKAHICHLLIVEVNHLVGIFHHRGGIAANEILTVVFSNTDDERRSLTGADDVLVVLTLHHHDGVGTYSLVECLYHSLTQIVSILLIVKVDEVAKYLSICLALKSVATSLKLVLQFLVVLDDAVVNQHHVTTH